MKNIKLLIVAAAALISGSAMAQKLECPDVTLENGTADLVFSLADNTDETATLVEFTLGIPEGLSIEKDGDEYIIDKGAICQRSHSAVANKKDNGDMLIIIMNTSGGAFKQTTGELAIMPIVASDGLADGSYQIQVKGVNITNQAAQKIAKETSFTISVTKGSTGIKDVDGDGVAKGAFKYVGKDGGLYIKTAAGKEFNAIGGQTK